MARSQHGFTLADDGALWFGGADSIGPSGRNTIYGTAGDDVLRGTDGGDNFNLRRGGDDTLYGGDGADKFRFDDSFTTDDVVYGGSGYDQVYIGAVAGPLTLGPDTLHSVERIGLIRGNYDITLLDGLGNLRIDAQSGERPVTT